MEDDERGKIIRELEGIQREIDSLIQKLYGDAI